MLVLKLTAFRAKITIPHLTSTNDQSKRNDCRIKTTRTSIYKRMEMSDRKNRGTADKSEKPSSCNTTFGTTTPRQM